MTPRNFALGLLVNLVLVSLLVFSPFPAPAPRIAISPRNTVTLIAPASLHPLPKPLPVLARRIPRPVPAIRPTVIPASPIIPPPVLAASPAMPASPAPAMPALTPQPVLGSFTSLTPPEPRPRQRRVVELTDLDSAAPAPANPPKSRHSAAASGFDAVASFSEPRASRPTSLVATAFDASNVPRKQSRNPETPGEGGFQPLEILSKPKPQYTAVARQLGIEGEVVLKVRFGAAGRIEVLQMISGLGYGLDDNAALAAAQIRFRPAQRANQPVDQIATLRIQFQLAQ